MFGAKHIEPPVDTTGVKVTEVPEDMPQFKRNYVAQVTDDVKITITMKTYSFGRQSAGELRQSDDKYVWFDPERVADRILDHTLVPLIEERIKAIFSLDKEFMNSNPCQYTDEKGTKWCKCN
jgi:hypothetical protein